MPPPFRVELLPHDPSWADAALSEAVSIRKTMGPCVLAVHHIGSTAIAGIRAKPVIDLLPVIAELEALDQSRPRLEAIGFQWWGEYGLPGRRYCTKDEPRTGRRLVQLHCYVVGSREIDRHLAFRDRLRADRRRALAYDLEKERCRDLHPNDSHAYADCKAPWIKRVEADALVRRDGNRPPDR